VEVTTPLLGRANLANILAATAVAEEFGVPLASVATRAAQLRPSAHRGEVVRLASGVTVIDDSYNANPTATKGALDVLAATAATRRIAVIGEMLELGEHAVELHEGVGRAAAKAGVDRLIAVGGGPAKALADAAIASGLAAASVRYFATSDEAADAAIALVKPGDLVLVKGSRGVKTDRVVDRLKAERGLSLIPTRLYLKNGRIKCEIAVAKGKKFHDKRESERAKSDVAEARAAVRESKSRSY